MNANINRVYVNPNFNRTSIRAMHTSDPIYSNNHLYVNPNFTRQITDKQQFTNLNRKIYVNPNFIKSTNTLEANEISESAVKLNYTTKSLEYSNSTINEYSDSTVCKTEPSKLSENISVCPSSKSRYHLIRRNDIKVLASPCQVKQSCTIKVTKYKSIPFHNFKNNLELAKNETAKQIPSAKCNSNTCLPQYVNRNLFKLVKHNLKPLNNASLKLTPKSMKIKRSVDSKSQLKSKLLNGIRKKNNIPCRLFTKYGKCIRNLYGTCEYLHDKKHVSLCRKFIKGICHDKQCLLSHELSSKKMPTCFFYLNGICSKDDCPYLHVKLSEKSKICHDFLKGYCDKGDMCVHRHVRQQINKNNDKRRYTLNKQTSNRNIKVDNISKSIKSKEVKRLLNDQTNLEHRPTEQIADDGDCRYFKDLQNKDAACEVLKPTRCKLGTLPSFISL